ncbi:MAG: hypothetical protein AAF492_00685 [Verrucomicrobiota bacterium]
MADSHLAITGMRVSGDDVVLTWISLPDEEYQIFEKRIRPDGETQFLPLVGGVSSQGLETSTVIPNGLQLIDNDLGVLFQVSCIACRKHPRSN